MRNQVLSSLAVLFLLSSSFNAQAALKSIELLPKQVKQGDTIEIRLIDDSLGSRSSGEATEEGPVVRFKGKSYKSFLVSKSEPSPYSYYRCLVTAPCLLEPGTYTIGSGDLKEALTVKLGGFRIQHIRLPKSKDNFISSPGEEETVNKAKATVTAKQLWTGKFQPPCKSRVSSTYGLRRMVNGKLLKDYFHSGVDYAGGLGTAVHAVQNGKVLIARNGWRLHGNTVCVDHGQGVLSFYIHLQKILVKEGQDVVLGQKIGTIGATGRANGPHLHFSIYVNENATNPNSWFAKEF